MCCYYFVFYRVLYGRGVIGNDKINVEGYDRVLEGRHKVLQGVTCACGFAQIVRLDRTMEQIVFPVPNICEFLTQESKLRVYYTTERDEQGSKINDFFLRSEDLFNEMNWQKKLRGTQEATGNANSVPCAWLLSLPLSSK